MSKGQRRGERDATEQVIQVVLDSVEVPL
jgi:hypothetical protein